MRTRLAVVALLALSAPAVAQPTGPQPWWPTRPRPLPFLHPLFTPDMVIQRDIPAPVWGWSAPGDKVRVTVNGKATGEAAVAGPDGRWEARVGPFPAGGPHEVVVAGGTQTATLGNVLFGDVWLCSGQSNMNWPVRLARDGEEEAKRADNPQIRSFTVNFYPALAPELLPQPARWEVCNPMNARNFTAVGYFFARDIQARAKVPVGIIHASVGATAAEAWVSGAALRTHMPFDFRDRLAELDDQLAAAGGPDSDYFRRLESWLAAADPDSAKRKYHSDPNLDTADWQDVDVPKPWADGGLKDFRGLAWFRAAVEIPEAWAGKDLSLALSVVKDADVVWFNGALIGATQTAGSTRTYLVDGRLVKPGKNLLVAAVVGPKDGPSGFCSGPANMTFRPAADPSAKPARPGGVWKARAAVPLDKLPPMPVPRVGHYKTITSFSNGMIAPLVPFGIKGVLWYQGEANGPFWLQYRRLLPTLIADWRARFGCGDVPFLIVSLAGYNALQTKPVEVGWAEIRESQWRTVRKVPNTGLAIAADIGDAKDIHPRNKQEVGRRLALVARHMVYGEKDLVYSGPAFDEMNVELPKGDRIRLTFKHVGGGLAIKDRAAKLTGFAVAGADKNFVWADAAIEGNTVVVSSPEVPLPKHVRYGWAWNPILSLENKEGLPAIPFRTDE